MRFKSLKYLLLFCLLGTGIFGFAQTTLNEDSLRFRELLRIGDTLYNRDSYDTAFQRYEKAWQYAGQKDLAGYYSATNCLLYMAHCFYNQKKYVQAHNYYYEALLNARKYSHHEPLKNTALRSLNSVHFLIQDKEAIFPYPSIKEVTLQKVSFDISRVVFQRGDSAIVEITGGLYDGLKLQQKNKGEAFAIKDPKGNGEYRYIGVATLNSLKNNSSIVTLKLRDTAAIQQGWQVKLYADIPDAMQSAGLFENYLTNINWKSTEGYLSLFNRRFYYYYFDDQLDGDMMDLLKSELQVIIKGFAADTLNPGHFVSKIVTDGIFKDKNIVRTLQETNGTAINYFLRYAVENKGSYSGQNYRFGDVYATWAYNNSPLSKDDARKFILGDEEISSEMIRKAKLLFQQSEANNWPDSWVDEALQQADKNYLRSLLSYGRLLNHYGRANNKGAYIGWAHFFDALRQKAFGKINSCDSFLNLANQEFKKANSVEGMEWVQSTRRTITDTSAVSISIQTGHLMPYDIYPSPNQRYFATGSDDYTIKIWDITLGKEIQTISAHHAAIINLAYNPGGRYLASFSEDSTIKVWNTFNYGLMSEFKPLKKQRSIKFTPDGKYLISSGYDSTINYWDPFTGDLVKSFRSPAGYTRHFFFHPQNQDFVYLTCTDSAVYEYNIKSDKFTRYVKGKALVTSFRISNNGLFGCILMADSTLTIVDIEKGSSVFIDKVLTWKDAWRDGEIWYLSQGDFSTDSKYFVFCRKDSNTVFLELSQLITTAYGGFPAKKIVFNSNGSYFIKQEFHSPPSLVYFTDFKPENPYQSLTQTDFKGFVNPVAEVDFSPDDRSLVYVTSCINQLDLTTGSTSQIVPYSEWTIGQHKLPLNDEILPYRKYRVYDTLWLFNRSKKAIMASLSMPGGEEISSYAFISAENKCLLTGKKGSLVCWDISEHKQLYFRPMVTGNVVKLNGIVVLPGNKKIVVYGSESKPYIIDVATGKVTDSIDIAAPQRMAFTIDGLFFTADSGRLFMADPVTYAIRKVIEITNTHKYLGEVIASGNGEFLFVRYESFCYVLETAGLKIIRRFELEGKNISGMALSHDDKTLAFASFNGQLLLYDVRAGKLISKIYTPLPSECIVTDSAGHYIASKQALQSVVFTYGGKAYNYDQFDLQLNQPHQVLAAIGRADSTTMKAYENAYLKRLQRNGLATNSKMQAKLPGIILLNRQMIKPTTEQDYCEVRVECFDLTGKLADIKVFVNEVPLTDSIGEWSHLDTSSKIVTIKIPLTTGNNKVKLYCVNQAGISSLKETININCSAKGQKEVTWFVGIGVNTYADAAMNLVYSAKDIRDLAASFKKIYPGIIIDTLINKQVTLQNMERLKQRLKQVKVNDRVIMAVTGHGLLSDSLDFYYATYDIDFKKPALKGLKYEDLESILNHTAARRKLLLIDACHSGMLDKETLLKSKEEIIDTKGDVTVKAKGARGIILNNSSQLNQSGSFDLMQNLFADLSNDNGIVVISAAGGLEYAFESKKWNNGVFTYSVRKGIDDRNADKTTEGGDGNGKVTVQELMRYVGKMVPELTRGQQRPTSRRENIEFDWLLQ